MDREPEFVSAKPPAHSQRPLRALLDDLARANPTPGAGSAAAWATALAAGLVEMVATITADGQSESEQTDIQRVRARASEARSHAVQLAEDELRTYAPVIDAMRLPQGDTTRATRLDAALSDASNPPLEVAQTAANVAELALEAAESGRSSLEGEATTAALLAAAACQSAARLVALNLAAHTADARVGEAAAAAQRADDARARVLPASFLRWRGA